MPHLIDITPTVNEALGVWPGDTAYSRSVALDMLRGDHMTLSSITTTVHLGAHVDGPNHYLKGAPGIGARSLDYYYGPCQVIEADVARGQRVRTTDLLQAPSGDALVQAPRVLIKTNSFPEPTTYNTDFAALEPGLIAHLHDAGVILVGIDTPSVDLFHSKALESHQAIAERDMAILEGVVLSDVAPGLYTLIALPLKLEGADASPVRAVLVAAD